MGCRSPSKSFVNQRIGRLGTWRFNYYDECFSTVVFVLFVNFVVAFKGSVYHEAHEEHEENTSSNLCYRVLSGMAKFAFFNFPTYGQVNPTLAIVRELVARGEEVVYFNGPAFQKPIEAVGARFQPYDDALLRGQRPRDNPASADNRRLALLAIHMLRTSGQMVPPLLRRVEAECPDCLVYSGMFLWARIIAHALGIPAVALRPTYASDARFRESMLEGTGLCVSGATEPAQWLTDELARLREAYALPFQDMASLARGNEDLTIVFLPRAFQPRGETFDRRVLFVGPCFHPERDKGRPFPFERLGSQPCLYISLGTIFNDKPDFYKACFEAFGKTEHRVVLALGSQIDDAELGAIPENFITASQVPQLEVLARTRIFISHGGMNSTMESLYFGVPLIVIPHINEQKMTARRVEELGLGIALDETAVTPSRLGAAVSRIDREPGFHQHLQIMRQHILEAGGYRKAADALEDFARSRGRRHIAARLNLAEEPAPERRDR
jgi:MGT family glycosyltransferase